MTKTPLMIKTDSQYSIKCVFFYHNSKRNRPPFVVGFQSWLKGWERNNFKTAQGHPVKNRDLIRYIQTLIDFRGQYGQRIRLMYVKGHAGIAGNEAADALANRGVLFPVEAERDWKSLRTDLLRKMDEISNADAQRVEMEEVVDIESESRKLRKVGSAGIRKKSTLSSSHVKDTMASTSSPSSPSQNNGSKHNVEPTSHPAIVPLIPVEPDVTELEVVIIFSVFSANLTDLRAVICKLSTE
jgi:ribonuclease HI